MGYARVVDCSTPVGITAYGTLGNRTGMEVPTYDYRQIGFGKTLWRYISRTRLVRP